MRLNESDSAKHKSTPAAKRAGRVSTAAARPSKSPRPVGASSDAVATEDQLRLRAYQLYLERNGRPGDPHEDWLRAERELIAHTQ